MNEKQYAVLLTETQDVRIIACNPEREMFDIAREAIGCDWIELVEAEPLAKDDLLMMIDEEGKLKPGGALINATASALYGTQQHGDPIMGNAVVVRTNGENLELLTAGEAKQLAARMENPHHRLAGQLRNRVQMPADIHFLYRPGINRKGSV